jgi:hypothetical protein
MLLTAMTQQQTQEAKGWMERVEDGKEMNTTMEEGYLMPIVFMTPIVPYFSNDRESLCLRYRDSTSGISILFQTVKARHQQHVTAFFEAVFVFL